MERKRLGTNSQWRKSGFMGKYVLVDMLVDEFKDQEISNIRA